MRAHLAPIVLALALLPAPALAGCTPIGAPPEVDTGEVAGRRFYVDNNLCQPDCAASVWVYEETNGIAGMQRGDFVIDDTCGGTVPADTLVAMVYARGVGA